MSYEFKAKLSGIYQIRALNVPDTFSFRRFNEDCHVEDKYKYERFFHTTTRFNYGDLLTSVNGNYWIVTDCAEEPTWFADNVSSYTNFKRVPYQLTETEYGFIASIPEFPLAWWWLKSNWLIQWAPVEQAAEEQREAYTAAFFDRAEL